MSAVNPASVTPTTGGDQRLYEPSMEEILASIRRIIADDQKLPGPSGQSSVALPVDAAMPPVAASSIGTDSHSSPQQHAPAFAPPGVARSNPVLGNEAPEAAVATSPTALRDTMVAPPHPAPATPVEALRVVPASEPFMSIVAGVASVPAAMHPSEVDGHGASTPARVADSERTDSEVSDAGLEEEAESIDPYFDPPIERDEPLPKAEPPAGLFSTHTQQSLTSSFNLLAATRLADNSEELLGLAREMIRPLLKTWLDDNLPSMVERMVRAEIERVARGGRD